MRSHLYNSKVAARDHLLGMNKCLGLGRANCFCPANQCISPVLDHAPLDVRCISSGDWVLWKATTQSSTRAPFFDDFRRFCNIFELEKNAECIFLHSVVFSLTHSSVFSSRLN